MCIVPLTFIEKAHIFIQSNKNLLRNELSYSLRMQRQWFPPVDTNSFYKGICMFPLVLHDIHTLLLLLLHRFTAATTQSDSLSFFTVPLHPPIPHTSFISSHRIIWASSLSPFPRLNSSQPITLLIHLPLLRYQYMSTPQGLKWPPRSFILQFVYSSLPLNLLLHS